MIQDCNFLMTKIHGGNKTICRNKAGKIQEYTNKFTETGALQVYHIHFLDNLHHFFIMTVFQFH